MVVAVQILFFFFKLVNVADISLLLIEALSFIYLDLITLM